jgi:hypothetical protein
MIAMILMSLLGAAPVNAQVQTCVWPHVCARHPIVHRMTTAQVEPCVWPRTCGARRRSA